jgi:hypothetical protein
MGLDMMIFKAKKDKELKVEDYFEQFDELITEDRFDKEIFFYHSSW